jgi:hypothetical protein
MEQTEKMKNYVYKILAAACALVLGGWSIANAVPVDTLKLSDSLGDSVTLGVGGSVVVVGTASTTSDFTSAGMVNWEGSIGGWTVTAETGTATPVTSMPELMGLSFSETSSGAGTLTIDWTAVGFGPSTGGFRADTGGTVGSGASLTYSTFYSTANAIPAGTALTSPLAFATPGGFNGSDSRAVGSLGSPFSLTQQIVINDTRAATSSGSATITSVPDAGSSLILLGAAINALGVFAGFNRRQWNRQWSR